MYREQTLGFQVEVEPEFVAERSNPEAGQYFFSYRLKISNRGDVPAKLLSRHWLITDGRGEKREVKGDGVVGEQPELAPGAVFEYSSFCPLTTPTGNMRGTFEMENRQTGERFKIGIPLFFLRRPN